MDPERTSIPYRQIVERTPDAIIFADCDGLIRLWNHGAEVVFGYTAGEIIGKSLDAIIPEDLRQRHWEGYARALAAAQTTMGTRVLTTRAKHRDGHKIYVDLSFAVLLGDSGNAIGAMALGRNVTEQYVQQKALRKQLAELQRKVPGSGK